MTDETLCKANANTPIRIGTVFSFTGVRINNGKRINNFVIEVGHTLPTTGIDSANDDTRMNAKYVVEHVKYIHKDDILEASFNSDEYLPRVYARKLNLDGTYNPNEELITFYTAYGASSFLSPFLMNIHKIMQRIITFVDSVEEIATEIPEAIEPINMEVES